MFLRLHRSPEGGDSAGTVTADAPASATQAPDIDVSQDSPSEASPKTQAPPETVNKGKVLAELLKKKPGYQATDAELEIFDEYTAGKLQPEGESEGEDPPENPDTPKPKEAKAPVESELMKELNAKTPAEALENLKKLKGFTGSRDAQAYAKLEKDHLALQRDSKAEMQLWNDLKDPRNAPKAIQYLESQLQAARARHGLQAGPQVNPQQAAKPFIDPSKFAVPEEAEVLNTALGERFRSFEVTIEKQAEIIRRLEEADNKRNQEHQLTLAQSAQLDEFVDVAALIPDLKSIVGLRDKVSQWLSNSELDIPELQVLGQVMAVANQEKIPLRVAWKVVEADRLRGQIAGAEDRGLKKAFSHKPNPSLSDMQGRGGITYTHYTDSQLKEMRSDHSKVPAEWFDKDDNLDKSKMPKRAIELLLPDEEGD